MMTEIMYDPKKAMKQFYMIANTRQGVCHNTAKGAAICAPIQIISGSLIYQSQKGRQHISEGLSKMVA